VEQIPTCSPWKGPYARARGYLKEAETLGGAHDGAGHCQDLQTRGERSPHQSRFAGSACDSVGYPRWSSMFLKDCTLWEGLTVKQFVEGLLLERFMENCQPWEGLHTGAGEESEEEGAAETTCDELHTTPIPCPPVPLWGRR